MGTGEGAHIIQGHLHPGLACPFAPPTHPPHPAAHPIRRPPTPAFHPLPQAQHCFASSYLIALFGRGVCQAVESLGIAVQLGLSCARPVVNGRVVQSILSLTREGGG